MCTPVSVAICLYRNNERATVALFSLSDVSAGQREEAFRLNPHSQTNKNKGSGQFHATENGIWNVHLLTFSPFISFVLNLFNSGLSPSDKIALNRAGHHIDPRPNCACCVFFPFVCFFLYYCHTQLQTLFWQTENTLEITEFKFLWKWS